MSGGVGCQGCIGGGKWTGSLTTLGPSPGSQHSHWFPLGSDLPHKGQARAPVEGPIRGIRRCRGVLWGWQGVLVLRGQKRYRWHKGAFGGSYGVLGTSGGIGAGRKCRYSGAIRGIGCIRGHLGAPRGCWGHQGCIGAGRGL